MTENKILKNIEEFCEDRRELFPSREELDRFINCLFKFFPPLIRVNTLKISPEKLFSLPSFQKIEVEKVGWGENLYKLKKGNIKGNVVEYHLGLFYLQSPSSALPVEIMELRAGQLVLDMCAAPGSKTTQIAQKMYPEGLVVANDIRSKRLESLGNNLEKLSFPQHIVTLMNGHRLGKIFPDTFDRVLLDAPCSGEGSWYKHSRSAVYRREYVKRSSNLQKQLIISAFKALKPGGIMVYSTCTFAPEENEEVVEFALQYTKGKLELLSIDLPIRGLAPGLTSYKGKAFRQELTKAVRVYPHLAGMPGFFLAKLRKIP